jgi:hypothetical protein
MKSYYKRPHKASFEDNSKRDMNDARTLEDTVGELQSKLEKELKIKQAAEQMLSTAKDKSTRTKIQGEIDKCMKGITIYSNDLKRVRNTLSVTEDQLDFKGTS